MKAELISFSCRRLLSALTGKLGLWSLGWTASTSNRNREVRVASFPDRMDFRISWQLQILPIHCGYFHDIRQQTYEFRIHRRQLA